MSQNQKPEHEQAVQVVPPDVAAAYQRNRREIIEYTEDLLDIARLLIQDPTTNAIGNTLWDKMVYLRKWWLMNVDNQMVVTALGYLHRQNADDAMAKYNGIVQALEDGDLTHDLIADFLETVGQDLHDEFHGELIAEVSRAHGTDWMLSIGLLGVLRGDTPGAHYADAVAQTLMRLAAQTANRNQESA